MGIRHGRPVSDSIRTTRKSSAAYLARRAAQQYIGLHVDGQRSDECFEAVQRRVVWIGQRHDARIRRGLLQRECATGHDGL